MKEKLLYTAISQYLTKEFAGSKHNPDVLKYFDEIGHAFVDDDETPWCSAFMNWIALKAGAERSGKLNARSWLEVGVETTEPQPGDVCVLWRGSKTGWQGHVGLFVTKKDGLVYMLGGNQNDMVCIAAFPEDRVLGYRQLNPAA